MNDTCVIRRAKPTSATPYGEPIHELEDVKTVDNKAVPTGQTGRVVPHHVAPFIRSEWRIELPGGTDIQVGDVITLNDRRQFRAKQVVVGSNPITRSFPTRITKTGLRGPVLCCRSSVRDS
jgi:hypothetical protein